MKKFKVGVIIVTYFPNVEDLSININNLLSEEILIFIFKNCNTKLPFENQKNIVIQGSGENIGLAAAQNIGLKYFRGVNVDFISTFDQDSKIPKNYLTDAIDNLIDLNLINSKIRVIVPSLIDRISKKPILKERVIKRISNDAEVLREATCSGMLMYKSVITDYGIFRDHFFIDYVDFEWIWRIRSYGEVVIRVNKLKLYHSLGEGDIKFFGKSISVCSCKRIYYQIRNLKYLKNYRYTPFKWLFKQKIKLIFRILIYTISTKDKCFIKYAIQGIKAYKS